MDTCRGRRAAWLHVKTWVKTIAKHAIEKLFSDEVAFFLLESFSVRKKIVYFAMVNNLSRM